MAPAPFIVAAYVDGEGSFPVPRPAASLLDAAEIARLEAGGTCRPVVRVYRVEPGECRLVLSVRL
jgi:hypothetical protein